MSWRLEKQSWSSSVPVFPLGQLWAVGWAAPLMARGGVVVSDQELAAPGWLALPLPEGVAEGRYFMYRVAGA